MTDDARDKWYSCGLHFECSQCGECCSGPGEGVIWVSRREIEFIADYLNIPESEFREKYLEKIGSRTTIIEEPVSRDCIFLMKTDSGVKCAIYPVRPTQCRSWPFWSSNLRSPAAWNRAASGCGGINTGPLHPIEEIEKKRTQKKWWTDE